MVGDFIMLKEIVDICHKNISNENAINYLKNIRKINEDTINEYRLGYMDDDILNYLYKKDKDYLIKNKILFINNDMKFSLLNNSIIIPIYNHYGELIAISSRAIIDRKPKYFHTIHEKNNNLFGLYNAIKNINKNYIIITEGQFDVMTAYQNGIQNICCTIGTTLTENQIAILCRYYEYIVICYDADKAGIQSSEKTISKYQQINGLKILSYKLDKDDEDIDSYIKKYGAKKLIYNIECTIKSIH